MELGTCKPKRNDSVLYTFTKMKKKFKDTKLGKFLIGEKGVFKTLANTIPDKGLLGVLKRLIVNDKQQYFGNKETFKHLTMGFWDNDIPFRRLLEDDEKVIVQAGLHPITDSMYPIYDTKRWFFDLFLEPNVVRKMKNGTLVLLLYQGWEAENYSDEIYSRVKADKYKTYYHMFRDVLDQYKLPKSSMIILSSNLFGNDHEDYGVNVIYDNIMEWNSLHRGIAKSYARRMLKETGHDFRSINIDYSVDEYLETIKNNDRRICRLSRTKQQQREMTQMENNATLLHLP